MNPTRLIAHAQVVDGKWKVDVMAAIGIKYPKKYVLKLFTYGGETFEVQEGLFYMLGEAGWYHPYVARWEWEVYVEEKD